jgi:hypothetical protein
MAKQFPQIEPAHRDFVEQQHIFFTASATAASRVNLSPKGLDGFRVIHEKPICYPTIPAAATRHRRISRRTGA